MMDEISFLIGAGFSANKGYPTGAKLNNLLLNCTGVEFGFSSGGTLTENRGGSKSNNSYRNSYDLAFDFLKELFQHFKLLKGHFDYEEFYDYLNIDLKADPDAENIASKYLGFNFDDKVQLYHQLKRILNQLISFYVKDENKKRHYDDEPYSFGKNYIGYTGILRSLSELSLKNILHVHTLNHDLLFESFKYHEFFKEISDGFEELGSPYFGQLIHDNRTFMCRLPRYTGKYSGNVRLYKLHGSFDYVLFHKSDGGIMLPDNYLKSRYGIGFSNLFKETEIEKELVYQEDWVNYHSDFLSGTTSKITRYNQELLFADLFANFKKNLENSKKLIIIGYGGRDQMINSMLLKHYNFAKFKPTIIEPFPAEPILELSEKLGAKIVSKNLEDISQHDI
jgi:hypothetical protein